jgi:hypothetical protein
MEVENFYVTLAAQQSKSTNRLEASTYLPVPIDTRNHKYDVSVLYSSLIPNWSSSSDFSIRHIDADQMEDRIEFDIAYIEPQFILPYMANELTKKYGSNMTTSRMKLDWDSTNDTYQLKIHAKSKIILSDGMQKMFGLPSEITNSESTAKSVPIAVVPQTGNILDDFYYLTCEFIEPNFITREGSMLTVLDFAHTHARKHNFPLETLQNGLRYHPIMDDIILSKLTVSVLNESGTHVETVDPEFIVVLQFRRRQ